VLLVWLVRANLLLRQLSLKMCHQSRRLLVRLLRRHHLLPHSLLQQIHGTELQQYTLAVASRILVQPAIYRVRQDNFLFHMAFHIQKRKLACRTLYMVCTQSSEWTARHSRQGPFSKPKSDGKNASMVKRAIPVTGHAGL
jgi:hypothetical protein